MLAKKDYEAAKESHDDSWIPNSGAEEAHEDTEVLNNSDGDILPAPGPDAANGEEMPQVDDEWSKEKDDDNVIIFAAPHSPKIMRTITMPLFLPMIIWW